MVRSSMMTRRSFINTSAFALAAANLPSQLIWAKVPTTVTGLKNLAPPSMLIGAVVDRWQIEDSRWRPIILNNFNLVTLGKLKMSYVRPTPDAFDFRETDWMVSFCHEKRIAMHGHNLCWNANNPQWLAQALNRNNAANILTDHIHTVMKRYAGSITSWDVVNEPVAEWMGRSDGLYRGPWLDALGPQYMDIAFHAAAEADPKALRVLNIAHVEQGGEGSDKARLMTLRLVEDLLRRGVPVQAIGLESHLNGNYSVLSTRSRSSFLHNLRQLGLQILITELDIDDTQLPYEITKRDAIVSECYAEYLAAILEEAAPSRVIFFSPGDQRNWYDSVHQAAYLRRDGERHRPGLFDSALIPKTAYNSVAQTLQSYRT